MQFTLAIAKMWWFHEFFFFILENAMLVLTVMLDLTPVEPEILIVEKYMNAFIYVKNVTLLLVQLKN